MENKTKRTLKLWNGRGSRKLVFKHISVAAYSKKQAAELINKLGENITVYNITKYFSNRWGSDMDGITPTEPCVYLTQAFTKSEPVKVWPGEVKSDLDTMIDSLKANI